MGYIKQQVMETAEVFNSIVANRPTFNVNLDGETPYGYFSDFIKDNYDVTLVQSDEICRMLEEHYSIKNFYGDKTSERKALYGQIERLHDEMSLMGDPNMDYCH